MKPIVEVSRLSVCYGHVEALRDLNFALAPGEVLGIIGPNGAGKTTTLSCIEGLLTPTEGAVQVFGAEPRRERRQVLRRMGVQLQDASYPLRIRTEELVQLYASFYKDPADWRTLLASMGLSGLGRRRVHSLSGGERQKLSILLALIGRPSLLILDEISTGLAPEARFMLRASLRQIAAGGTAMIVVTHYPDELEGLADRLLLLEAGRARFLGTPDAFRRFAGRESGEAGQLTLEQAYLAACPPGAAGIGGEL